MSADHQARLDRHDLDIRELREGQTSIITKLDKQDSALGAIANSLTEIRAQKGPPWHQIIGTASQVVLVFGAAVSAIVYVASNGASPQQHALDKRVTQSEWELERVRSEMKRLDRALGWRPTIKTD